jgi:putative inorganic carbon (hco3(-)) transporter
MRDLILTAFLFGSVPFILWRPTIGVFLWIWVSVMSPHRLTWDFAYDFPFAQVIAVATLVGMLFSREPKRLPITSVTVVLLILLLWMNVTTYFAIDTARSLPTWEKVMKVQLMVFVTLYLLHSRRHLQVLIWVLAGSVAFFGIKGGLFTLRGGGEYRVWGPPGSFIEDNNALALALVVTIPLLRYLHLQATNRWVRWGLVSSMILCGFSALGSQSRGALLAIITMLSFLWLKSRGKVITGLMLALLVPLAIGFMPENWEDRMKTIQNYEQDGSAMGRINAWTMAINVANDRPLIGGGFEMASKSVYARYAPDPTVIRAAHSIYFQVLGEHGYVGLALFLLLWILVWRDASWIFKHTRSRKELHWMSDLARMIQVSLAGYAVGGAFLDLAYYDVPYNLLVAVVLMRVLVEKEIKSVDREVEVPARPQMTVGRAGSQPAVPREPGLNRR